MRTHEHREWARWLECGDCHPFGLLACRLVGLSIGRNQASVFFEEGGGGEREREGSRRNFF